MSEDGGDSLEIVDVEGKLPDVVNVEVGGALPGIISSTEVSVVWNTRRWVAFTIAVVIGVVSITLIIGVLTKRLSATDAKDLGTVILTPLFTILSAAVTFIFSEKAGN